MIQVNEAKIGDRGASLVGDRACNIRIKRRRNSVKHVGVHVRMDGPVGRGVITCGDEDGVALRDSNGEDVGRRFLDVRLYEPEVISTLTRQKS
jgi:hypothetical protein